MSQQPDYDQTDDMFGGGASLSFADPVTTKNRWRGGTIIAPPVKRQRTNYQTKQPEYWPDGAPKMQVLVKLQTTERDPANPQDDGVRTLFVKGNMQNAVATALRNVGAPGLRVGGELFVMWTGEQASTKGAPQKLFAAQYRAPTPEALATIAAQQAAAVPVAPVQQQGPAPQFAQPDQQQWPPAGQQPAQQPAQQAPAQQWPPAAAQPAPVAQQAPAWPPAAPQQPVAPAAPQPPAQPVAPAGAWPPAAAQPQVTEQQPAQQPPANPFAAPAQPAQAPQAPPWAQQG